MGEAVSTLFNFAIARVAGSSPANFFLFYAAFKSLLSVFFIFSNTKALQKKGRKKFIYEINLKDSASFNGDRTSNLLNQFL